MQTNVTYDASVADAPAGLQQAVQAAVGYLYATISDNITVSIALGWGEVNRQAIASGALARATRISSPI